jgi:hypothetical protein
MDVWLQRHRIEQLKFGSYRPKPIFVDAFYTGIKQLFLNLKWLAVFSQERSFTFNLHLIDLWTL